MTSQSKNKGWLVTFSGTGINLALGILYTWSIFKGAIKESIDQGGQGAFQWEPASLNDPYAVCCIVFAFAMILAGKCQDRFGPRITAFIGGLLVGLGFILISQSTNYVVWVLGFGVLAGTGIGFGYSSATPPALKWFPPEKTGLIAGLVVSGFGLASVYIAPLSQYLLGAWGLQKAMLFFGIAFFFVVCGLSLLLINPPPETAAGKTDLEGPSLIKPLQNKNSPPSEMMKTRTFYMIWVIYFIGAGAGLMVIGSVAGMAKESMGNLAFLAVAILAVGNAGGRIVAGVLSDKIGRRATLLSILIFQAVLMLIAIPVVGSENAVAAVLVLLATFIGFNYGANLSLFPSLTKDQWGMSHFGINYGIVFTAWGVGGFVMGRLSQMLQSATGGYTYSFLMAAALLVVGAFLTFTLEGKRVKEESPFLKEDTVLTYEEPH
ncbi:MAG: OFA family MFS transporter [Deltaproteobacteria bacterium]|nr:OFA family MFS transporter [Deltaproteobacteria bacterium]